VNTIEEHTPFGRRRRRSYSREFKAQVVAACQGPGVSIAAIALHHQLNANLLRRWVDKAEAKAAGRSEGHALAVPTTPAAAFVQVPVETRTARATEIRVEVCRGDQSITVSWPSSEAAQCAAWLREWLR
jgi:transposase-like protein